MIKQVMISYEDFLLWKKYQYQIWKLRDILEKNYGIDPAKIYVVDHNYGRKIEVHLLPPKEETYAL